MENRVRKLAVVVSIVLFLLSVHAAVHAQVHRDSVDQAIIDVVDDIDIAEEVVYFVRLHNGDLLSGPVREIANDAEGTFIRLGTEIGRAKVYLHQIAWIGTQERSYRQHHRLYIMPTAEPIGKDHFLGLWELLFLYGGVGIGDVVSITAGRTAVPGIPFDQQVSAVTAKATVYAGDNGIVEGGKQYYAVGVAAGWLNDANFLANIFAVATFTGKRSSVTTMMFAKVAGPDVYTFHAGRIIDPFNLTYASGKIGVGLGLDSRIEDRHDIHVVGELWNADITRPSNTALYLGLRLANTAFSMDFGMTVLTAPAVVPTVAFAWTPF